MSHENVEIAERVLWGGVGAVSFARDDATWMRYKAETEAILEPDCGFAWMRDDQRVEVTACGRSILRAWPTLAADRWARSLSRDTP